MNLQGLQPIHESNLVKGELYYYKNRFGEGVIQAFESVPDGWKVEIREGGFMPPLKKYKAGALMLVPNGDGKFYEMKA